MKILDKLIKKTKIYQKSEWEKKNYYDGLMSYKEKYNKLNETSTYQADMIIKQNNDIDKLTKELLQNKTIARRIIRKINSLLKKDELVSTKKEIQALCHEIIKGEKL